MRHILWFRRDLRIEDHPLLSVPGDVLPIFIFDPHILQTLDKDDKRVSLIFGYVQRLKEALKSRGLDLKLFWGKPLEIITLLQKEAFDDVIASGDYDAYARQRDLEISLRIDFNYIHDTYVFRPDEVLKDDGSPYLVFTPFYKKAKRLLASKSLPSYLPVQQKLLLSSYDTLTKVEGENTSEVPISIESLGFEPTLIALINPNEKLRSFTQRLNTYEDDRDFLSKDATSALSIDLRFGTISIRELLRQTKGIQGSEAFIRQLLFRDYYAYLLYHFPNLETQNYKYRFNGIEDEQKYHKFCTAQTGVPIVDAGITQLVQTGKMHNRVRMIVASFLTKDLLLPWQWGEKFFARYLLDYDKASNVLSWQWSAGTGIDPQPYFRVFNPYLQSKKFDKEAHYIKEHLPILQDIEAKNLHDEHYLLQHSLNSYPHPIVVHKEAAKKAIDAFK